MLSRHCVSLMKLSSAALPPASGAAAVSASLISACSVGSLLSMFTVHHAIDPMRGWGRVGWG